MSGQPVSTDAAEMKDDQDSLQAVQHLGLCTMIRLKICVALGHWDSSIAAGWGLCSG